MEYSVNDLIKILLKKWYIILLVVCLMAAASFYLSNASFQQAKQDYQYYTTLMEKLEEGTGNATAEYTIDVDSHTLEALYDGNIEALLLQDLDLVLFDTDMLASAQQAVDLSLENEDDPIMVSDHIQIELLEDYSFRITIEALPENLTQMILSGYIAEVRQTLGSPITEVTLTQTDYQFAYSDPALSDSAELAQLIMREPVAKPSIVRTVVTTAVFSFALACIGILMITFAKDSAAQNKKEASEQADKELS